METGLTKGTYVERDTVITPPPPVASTPLPTVPLPRVPVPPVSSVPHMSVDKAKRLIAKTSAEHAGLFRRLAK